MDKKRLAGRTLLLMVFGVACAGVLSVLSIRNGNSGDQQTIDAAAMNDERILPSQVTLSNLEAFKEQMRHDLPSGTPKTDVEAYLTRWNIRHTYVDHSAIIESDRNSFHGTLDNIGTRIIFRASLSIRIRFDADDKVREIEFRVEYL